jgi:hypothetical protein
MTPPAPFIEGVRQRFSNGTVRKARIRKTYALSKALTSLSES